MLSAFIFFLSVYMNNIPSPQRTTNLFADDTFFYVISKDAADLASLLQSRIDVISTWFRLWQLSVNTAKSAVMVFQSQRMRQMQVQVSIDSSVIPQVATHRHLGLVFSETLRGPAMLIMLHPRHPLALASGAACANAARH